MRHAKQPLYTPVADEATGSARELRAFRQLDFFLEQQFSPDDLHVDDLSAPTIDGGGPASQPDGTDGKPIVVVQFATPIFFGDSREGVLRADIMRIGTSDGRSEVRFQTVEGTAKAGEAFEGLDLPVVFEDGEDMKTIDVPIMNPTAWHTTCEFKMRLISPQGCVLGSYLHTARVKVMGLDTFPTNAYDKEDIDGTGPFGIDQWNLFRTTVCLVFGIRGTGWRAYASILLAQLHNIYLFATIYVSKYLVDVVFSKDEESLDELWFHVGESRGRMETAMAIAAIFLLPMLLLHIVDLLRVNLNFEGKVNMFLKVNLFNQYLNYDEQSRFKMGASRLQNALGPAVEACSKSVGQVLEVAGLLGKMFVLVFFVYEENPQALVATAVMPVLMVILVYVRSGVLRIALKRVNEARVQEATIISETCQKYSLIADYQQRPLMIDVFTASAEEFDEADVKANSIAVNSACFGRILGPLFICTHIALHTHNVLSGEMSLGSFLTTITVFKEFSELYSEAYATFLRISSSLGALQNVTQCFNMRLDLEQRKAMNRMRRERLKKERESLKGTASLIPRIDRIAIQIDDLNWSYNNHATVFRGLTVSAEQGSVVAIRGEHGVGKTTLMRILANSLLPEEGITFIPSHLRGLFVPEENIVLGASLWANLTFGFGAAHPNRVVKILKGFGMDQAIEILRKELDDIGRLHEIDEDVEALGESYLPGSKNVAQPDGHGFGKGAGDLWSSELTNSEKSKISLVRALIVNPEVLILQRPTSLYDDEEKPKVWACLMEHVNNRGYFVPRAGAKNRRPRTLFYSPSVVSELAYANVIWEFSRNDRLAPSQAVCRHQETQKSDGLIR